MRFEEKTPLHWAASGGKTKTAIALIDRGADIEAKDVAGRTPLHLVAARMGATKTVIALIDKGADINPKDALGH